MDNVLDRPWTAESFLAREDKQEGKYEFDGQKVIPMAGGGLAHQHIVFDLKTVLARVLAGRPVRAAHEMRIRIGDRVRIPDAVILAGPLDQTT